MYEQTPEQTSGVRRIVVGVITLAAIIAVLWVAVWLLFLKGDNNTSKTGKTGSQAQQSPAHSGSSSKNSGSSKSQSNNQTGSQQGSGSNAATNGQSQTPDQLANAGAGNVLMPAATAAIAGAALYHIRLRRKLAAR